MMEEPGASKISAEELARQCQRGCRESFDRLVLRFEQRVLRFLDAMVNNRQDAEDLAQDTFLKAYKSIHRFNPEYKFATWLFTIAKRTAMNHYRDSRPTLALNFDQEADEQSPAAALEQKEWAKGLWDKAKRYLKPSQYRALRLRYGEELSIAETAAVMQTKEIRVRVLLHRARKQLAKQLGDNRL